MASAMFNPHYNPYLTSPGSEPDQVYTRPFTNFDLFWQPNEFDWSDLDFLDPGDIDMNWMGQPLDETTMAQLPGSMSSDGANMEREFLSDSGQLSFPLTHPDTFTPDSIPWASSSLSSSLPFNIPSTTAPYPQSPPMPSSSPPTQRSYSTPPNSRKPFTCTVCQPNRSYASLQNLKRHQKRHKPQITCLSPTCSIRFAEKKDMKNHVQARHPGVLPPERYFCRERGCGSASKGFSREDNLKRHLKDMHG